MRTLIIALAATLTAVALVGCGGEPSASATGYAPDQTVHAYDYVHGGYVGRAEVTTSEDGDVNVTFNEAFLPHTLAVVDMASDPWTENNTISYVSHGSEYRVAKYVVYEDTTYVGTTYGTGVVWVEADDQGSPAGGTGLEKAIIRNETTMGAYYDAIADGGFGVLPEFGAEPITVETTSYGSLYKNGSSYWPEGSSGLGWKANIEAIESAAEEHGVRYTFNEMTRNDDNEWQLADAVTGATASDFQEYFALVQLAVARLESQ